MTRFHERLAKLEAARPPSDQTVRTHVLDCVPEHREERIAAIKAAEPNTFHIFRIIVRAAENGIGT